MEDFFPPAFVDAPFEVGFLIRAPSPFPSACFAMCNENRSSLPRRAKLISLFNLTGLPAGLRRWADMVSSYSSLAETDDPSEPTRKGCGRLGSLTSGRDCSMDTPVRGFFFPMLVAVFFVGSGFLVVGQTQRKVPQTVLDQAEAATRDLGKQVILGNHAVALERMYPRWKKRAAKKLRGGKAELAQRLEEIPRQMARQGITMLRYEVKKPVTAHEVVLLRGEDKAGRPIQMFLEWLVFVPTRAEYRVIDPQTSLSRRVETFGYQIAVNKKGTADWHFIDGRNLTIANLRSFFPSLPENPKLLGLPKVGGGEIK